MLNLLRRVTTTLMPKRQKNRPCAVHFSLRNRRRLGWALFIRDSR